MSCPPSFRHPRAGHAPLFLALCVAVALPGTSNAANRDGTAPSPQAQRTLSANAVTGNYFQGDGAGDGTDDALASGAGAVAGGASSVATGDASTALGYFSQAYGTGALSLGSFSLADGLHSAAVGDSALATADYASAMGYGSSATGTSALAVGGYAEGTDDYGVAVARLTSASGQGATALGAGADASGDFSIATGFGSNAGSVNATAIGTGAQATGASSVAIGGAGRDATGALLEFAPGSPLLAPNAAGLAATAIGSGSEAAGDFSIAFGAGSFADGAFSIASGYTAYAPAVDSIALGRLSTATGDRSVSIGMFSHAVAPETTAVGGALDIAFGSYQVTSALAARASAFGGGAIASGVSSTALGAQAQASGDDSIAIGTFASANLGAKGTIAIGAYTQVDVTDGVALGSGSRNYREGTVSFGSDGSDGSSVVRRQLTNVADGADDFDAVNLGQLNRALSAIGGPGASYLIQGTVYDTLQDAFGAVDRNLTDLSNTPPTSPSVPSGNGPGLAVGAGSSASDGTSVAVGNNASAPATNSVAIGAGSVTTEASTVSVGSAGAERRVTNVAAGVHGTDAANVSQMDEALTTARSYADQGDAATLSRANAYTDTRISTVGVTRSEFDSFRDDTNHRFQSLDRDMKRSGAMGQASTQMAINAAGATTPGGRVAVGMGTQGGQQALSVGYARSLGERAHVSIGGAFSGSQNSAGVGFGVDL
ncbi:YadA family autotransporter adhesin [Luteibacter aegosomatissinici]|uniref:YadA family autotransporter adhesin n=1 Tax=Luteibacter aegosomatissinici TaxID=2911539 RepID=UPI001FFA2289|nr:YadA-like family protein [Luteibacter aegosomatissinici]UPG92678.1 YadA-like family protein [Luteibacter aegosomatissinici]